MIDVVIIGAGPSGLQLAYYLEKKNINYRIVERDCVASFFKTYPRDRKLISFNKKHSIYKDPEVNLRWDWNSLLTEDYSHPFSEYSDALYPSADELVEYLQDFSKEYSIDVEENTEIKCIEKTDFGNFSLKTSQGESIETRYVVVSTGFTKEFLPNIHGIENIKETYSTVSINKDKYIDQRVLIIGKGNSSFEIANQLLDVTSLIHLVSPESIIMAWQSRHPGHIRANYSNILDAYQLKTLHGVLDANILSVRMVDDKYHVEFQYVHADDEIEIIEYDHVILCAGFKFDKDIFSADLEQKMLREGRLPAITSEWESDSISGLFFNGTLTQSLDFKASSSAFIDGFRYNSRSLANILKARLCQSELNHLCIPFNSEELANYIQNRVCNTSSLWTQFGSLADVLCVDNDEVKIFQDTSINYQIDVLSKSYQFRIVLTFEWGEYNGNVFEIERHPSNEMATTNIFLHPILRTYFGTEKISEHHILEDLFGMYSAKTAVDTRISISGREREKYHHEEHTVPLKKYMDSVIDLIQNTEILEV